VCTEYGEASFDATKYCGLRVDERYTRGVMPLYLSSTTLTGIDLWLKVASMTVKLIALD
jgi:hypothetical protein